MKLFRGGSKPRASRVMTASAEDLVRIGSLAYGGSSPHPPGTVALEPGELDRYAIAAMDAGGYPGIGSQSWIELEGQFLDALLATSHTAGPWATVGALLVAANFVAPKENPDARYLEILDRACEFLRRDGVSYTAVPPFAIERWKRARGFDGIHPAGWPSALEEAEIPGIGQEPPVQDLASGESRRLAQREIAGSKSYFAERRPDGTVVAVIEGVPPEAADVRRWDWEGLSAPSYVAFLRELGERLITPTEWAHEDLTPYFPCRDRSREDMRRLAAAYVAS